MKFEVDTNQLSSTIREFQQTLEQVNRTREQLYRAFDELGTTWKGEAHDSFQTQFHNDNQRMAVLLNEILDASNQMSDARSAYDSSEESALRLIKSIPL